MLDIHKASFTACCLKIMVVKLLHFRELLSIFQIKLLHFLNYFCRIFKCVQPFLMTMYAVKSRYGHPLKQPFLAKQKESYIF